MSLVEGIVGLIASVIAIIGAIILVGRWLAKKFDRWMNEMVANTRAMQTLTLRVLKLELAIKKGNGSDADNV